MFGNEDSHVVERILQEYAKAFEPENRRQFIGSVARVFNNSCGRKHFLDDRIYSFDSLTVYELEDGDPFTAKELEPQSMVLVCTVWDDGGCPSEIHDIDIEPVPWDELWKEATQERSSLSEGPGSFYLYKLPVVQFPSQGSTFSYVSSTKAIPIAYQFGKSEDRLFSEWRASNPRIRETPSNPRKKKKKKKKMKHAEGNPVLAGFCCEAWFFDTRAGPGAEEGPVVEPREQESEEGGLGGEAEDSAAPAQTDATVNALCPILTPTFFLVF